MWPTWSYVCFPVTPTQMLPCGWSRHRGEESSEIQECLMVPFIPLCHSYLTVCWSLLKIKMTISGVHMDSRNPCNNYTPPKTRRPADNRLGTSGVRPLNKVWSKRTILWFAVIWSYDGFRTGGDTLNGSHQVMGTTTWFWTLMNLRWFGSCCPICLWHSGSPASGKRHSIWGICSPAINVLFLVMKVMYQTYNKYVYHFASFADI